MKNDNKLIAEFMGGEYVDEHLIEFKNFYSVKEITEGEFVKTDCFDSDNELQYHTSWDWLMPVVEKIEALKYRVEISHNGCLIESHKDLDTARMNSGIGEIEPTKLKATYKAVVEFIKTKI